MAPNLGGDTIRVRRADVQQPVSHPPNAFRSGVTG